MKYEYEDAQDAENMAKGTVAGAVVGIIGLLGMVIKAFTDSREEKEKELWNRQIDDKNDELSHRYLGAGKYIYKDEIEENNKKKR